MTFQTEMWHPNGEEEGRREGGEGRREGGWVRVGWTEKEGRWQESYRWCFFK